MFLHQTIILILSIERVLKTLPSGAEETMRTHLKSSYRHRVRCLSHIVPDVRLRALSVVHTIQSISKEGDLLPGTVCMCIYCVSFYSLLDSNITIN